MAVDRDFSTKESCQLSINYEYNQARLFQEGFYTLIGDFNVARLSETDPITKSLFKDVRDLFYEVNKVLYRLINYSSSYSPPYGVPCFLKNHIAAGEEYVLSWEKIVAAWADADMLGRLWTTLSIDFMRKEVWDEPVTDFALRAGKPNE